MKKFLFLYRGGAPQAGELSPAEMQAHLAKWDAWVEDLTRRGVFQGGEALGAERKLVRGDGSVLDGPFTESKEIVGGYSLVHAPDEATAVAHARECPIFEYAGSVEVSAIVERCLEPGN